MASLRQYYLTLGRALIESNGNQILFRRNVVFLPVEILESYLQDLLTPRITNDALCIKPEPVSIARFAWVPLVLIALFILISISLKLTSPLFMTALLGSTVACVSGALVFYSLAQGMLRRMKFARMVHSEIIRRRGSDGTMTRILPRPTGNYPAAAGLVH